MLQTCSAGNILMKHVHKLLHPFNCICSVYCLHYTSKPVSHILSIFLVEIFWKSSFVYCNLKACDNIYITSYNLHHTFKHTLDGVFFFFRGLRHNVRWCKVTLIWPAVDNIPVFNISFKWLVIIIITNCCYCEMQFLSNITARDWAI